LSTPKGRELKTGRDIRGAVARYILHQKLIGQQQVPEAERSHSQEDEVGDQAVFGTAHQGKVLLNPSHDSCHHSEGADHQRGNEAIMAQLDHRS